MGKKASSKPKVDKVVERVNKEFEKTSQRIEQLINDALKQFDGLQSQIQEPVKKLLKEVDELRDREVKRFTEEFDRRMGEFNELQNNVMERLGISNDSAGKKSTGKSAKKSKPAAKKSTPKKAAKKPAAKKTAAPKAAAKKPAAAKSAAAKAPDSGDLTRVKGIGPATAKKMKEAGITSIAQIANPSAADQEKLAAFSSVKNFSTLSTEAKKVL